MMGKIEHIGIAVENLQEAIADYEKILGVACYKKERVEDEGVITAFFKTGENKIELLEGTRSDSPIAKFLAKRGGGIHHIAFEVQDIEAEMKRLTEAGFTLLNKSPKPGADGKLVCFLHPKEAHGVLIELCQQIGS
jgi:methylmalonyl-CoA/ethylmalonyl-CoA epimerase